MNKNIQPLLAVSMLLLTANFCLGANDLVLVGFGHGPLSGAPKFAELYALNDIPDLSVYGLGSANNGGGSDGQEWAFPAGAVTAGTTIYVSNDTVAFTQFMGFSAHFEDGGAALNFNGDDAMELFENGIVIDVFGDINVDGTGTSWEYTLGWVKRKNGTGPDGTTFMESNWTYSGVDALSGQTTNATSPNPYPAGPYQSGGGSVTKGLVLVGLIYANADVKVTEYYVVNDIPDLSVFGLGCANNGGGTDGQEWTFPAMSASAGDRIFVARDSAAFASYFGFEATFYDPSGAAHNFNGDDAFEVFENGQAIDIYGLIDVDGTGEPWEYSNTWAQRKCATGPDDSTFVLDNWTVATPDVLSGTATNIEAPEPYPVGAYLPTPCGGGTVDSMNVVITEIMYNSPGTDLEYLEIYNNTNDAIDLTGYRIANAFDFTFPSYVLGAGQYVLISDDSLTFENFWGMPAFQWGSGSLNNSGEAITLLDANGMVQDSVNFGDTAPWPTTPDGRGPSLALCDPDADNNDGSNWQRAVTSSGKLVDGREVFGNPGEGAACVDVPIIAIQAAEAIVGEQDGTVTVQFYIGNPNSSETSVEVALLSGGSAGAGDFTFVPATVVFPAGTDTAQTITLEIIDDAIQEPEESFTLQIINPTNGAIITNDTMRFSIIDNDAPLTNALKIIGLVHGPYAGVPKAVELYTTADIPNLSLFGLGCANNGGGSDGQEYTFPPVSLDEGTCFFVTNDTVGFLQFFGFRADFQDDGAANNFNGDDAYEIFENGEVIDVFGDINADGTGTDWEYTLGWVHRKPGTGPDGSTFVLDNWEYSGIDVFTDSLDNATAPVPYPVGQCTMVSTEELGKGEQILVYPNPTSDYLQVESEVLIEKITVFNRLGQVSFSEADPDYRFSLDFSQMADGIYLLQLVSGSKTWVQKVVVNR
ncbi:MAG: lamin tail domain-containing protein [Lewinellaceae bacterium]|nr:lamin tail domain-containing protein [Lewinellaceae bacterium]